MKRKYILTTLLALALVATASATTRAQGLGEMRAGKPDRTKVKQVLRVLKTEPTIRQVQRWAVGHYKLEPDRVNGMAANARLKGLVPSISVNLENSVGNQFTNTKDGLYPILPSTAENPNPDNLKERVAMTDDRLGWNISASWQLDRLLFSGEAIDAKSLTTIQENLVREITTLYFSRQRVVASLIMSPPQEDEEFFYEIMRLEELTATLDAFTGGKFKKKSWAWEDKLLK